MLASYTNSNISFWESQILLQERIYGFHYRSLLSLKNDTEKKNEKTKKNDTEIAYNIIFNIQQLIEHLFIQAVMLCK